MLKAVSCLFIAPCIYTGVIRTHKSCDFGITCSCVAVDTLQHYEPEKFNKAVAYYEDKAVQLPSVLYFNKGL